MSIDVDLSREPTAVPPSSDHLPHSEAPFMPQLKELELPGPERLMREVKKVGVIALDRQMNKVHQDTTMQRDVSMKPKSVLISLLQRIDPIRLNGDDRDAENVRGMVDGLKVKDQNGRIHTIKKIISATADTFFVDNGVDHARIPIPRDTFIRHYMIDKKDELITELPQNQQKATAFYIDVERMRFEGATDLQINQFIESNRSDVNNSVIESAHDMGLPTSQQLKNFVLSITGANSPEPTAEQIELANTYLSKLSETTLVEPDVFKQIFSDASDNDEIHELMGAYGTYIDQYVEGQISSERAQTISAALESGDIDKVLESISQIEEETINGLEDNERAKAEAELEEKRRRRREMMNKIGIGGLGALGVALLLLYAAVSASGQGGR